MFGKATILARVKNYNKRGGDNRHYETYIINSRDMESTINKIESKDGEVIKIWNKRMSDRDIEQYKYHLYAQSRGY